MVAQADEFTATRRTPPSCVVSFYMAVGLTSKSLCRLPILSWIVGSLQVANRNDIVKADYLVHEIIT